MRNLGPLYEGAGHANSVTGGVSCLKNYTPSDLAFARPRQIVKQVQHFQPKLQLAISSQDIFWDGC